MNFRKINIEEFDKLKRLFPGNDGLWKKYKKQRLDEFEKNEIDVFVIENENKFIGELTINYVSHDLLSEAIQNQRVYFEAFRVDKKFQGKGLGQELIYYCINTLANEGYTEFTIGLEDDNEVAKHIYFKYGFTEAIDKGHGDKFDPREYTLYINRLDRIENTLNKLISKLKLGTITQKPIRVSGGLLNRMYKVVTSSGIYAIKHLNPEVMKRPNAKNNHIFAEKIANLAKENNIQCISANNYNGQVLQEIDGNYFLIFDWFEGKSIKDNEITIDKVKKVAKQLARLHQIDFSSIQNDSNLGKEIVEFDWKYYISKIDDAEVKDLLEKNINYLNELDKKSTNAALKISSNKVISHRDLDLPNILWDDKDNPVLIDWESSGLINPCEELLETAWDWSGGQDFFDKEKFDCFINTYKSNGGNISDLEDAIISNFKNKSGWLEYNLKRLCKIECVDNEEQELGKKEVIRVINEIIKFYDVMKSIKIEDYK
ncbi:MAG: GNAT family N-acetyltransferase [Candidatus Scatovivens sp.]